MALFDRLAETYDRSRGGEEGAAAVAALIGAELQPSCPVVELGVGTGLVADALSQAGWEVIGLDVSAEMLARASQRGLHRLLMADGPGLPAARTAEAR